MSMNFGNCSDIEIKIHHIITGGFFMYAEANVLKILKRNNGRNLLRLTIIILALLVLVACGSDVDTVDITPQETQKTEETTMPQEEHLTTYYDNEQDFDLEEFMGEYFDRLAQQEIYYYFLLDTEGTRQEEHTIEGLMAVYRELNEKFNFLLFRTTHFDYIGYFSGDEMFVNTPPVPIEDVVFRNQLLTDDTGNNFYYTPIRGIQIGKMLYRHFDSHITQGRNFNQSDFFINSLDDAISVVLGFNYIGVYDVGDIITLQLYAVPMDLKFRVIGFFEEGTGFPNMDGSLEMVYFDNSIIMPLFTIIDEPTDELGKIFQIRLYAVKTSGYVRIMEHICADTTIEVHARYSANINEVANRHGVMIVVPVAPMPRPMH